MNILFLSQVLPYPLDAGPKIRAYFTLRQLCRHHRVTLLSYRRGRDRRHAEDHLRTFCREVYTVPIVRSRWKDCSSLVRSWATHIPFLMIRDRSADMKRKLEFLARRNRVIHVDQLNMVEYALQQRRRREDLRVVLDLHNAMFRVVARLAILETNPVRRFLLFKEAGLLRKYELATLKEVDRIVWVNREDCSALREGAGEQNGANETVIPIAIEPSINLEEEVELPRFRVTFIGGLHWPPNEQGVRWLLSEIWPRVLDVRPSSRLTIIGARPTRSLLNYQKEHSSVEVTGYVEDPARFFRETRVFIVPLQSGSGMRVKILEAWKHGLPVVSTTVGAEGLHVRRGENLLIADDAGSFAAAICSIFSDRGLAHRMSQASRQTVKEHFDWKQCYAAWDQVYAGL